MRLDQASSARPVAHMRNFYGRVRPHTYIGRVFIHDRRGPDTWEETPDPEPVRGRYFDAWDSDADHVRLDPVYAVNDRRPGTRHIYDPGRAFRRSIAAAYDAGHVYFD